MSVTEDLSHKSVPNRLNSLKKGKKRRRIYDSVDDIRINSRRSVEIVCQHCNHKVKTTPKLACDFGQGFQCFCCLIIPFLVLPCCFPRITYEHFCPKCNRLIDVYSPCC